MITGNKEELKEIILNAFAEKEGLKNWQRMREWVEEEHADGYGYAAMFERLAETAANVIYARLESMWGE